MPVEDGVEDVGDVDPADAAGQEGLDRHLVGGVERGRGDAAGPSRPVGQVEAREGVAVGRLEIEARQLAPVDGTEPGGDAVGVGQGVADGQAHVGHRQLGDGGAVGGGHHGVHDRLRVHDDVDVVETHAVLGTEQLVRLDDLEPLVHERRRVDRDLGSHAPRGVGQGVVDGDLGQVAAAAPPERTARGGEHDLGHPAARRVAAFVRGHGDRAQAHVHGAVLGVDRHQLGARGGAGVGHDGPRSDERLLVGQRQALAGLQRSERDGQAGEADDAVHADVGDIADGRQGVGAGHDLGAGGDAGLDGGGLGGVGDGDDLGTHRPGLLDQRVDRGVGPDGHHLEPFGLGGHDLEGLGADGTGRPGDRDRRQRHRVRVRATGRSPTAWPRSRPRAARTAGRRSGP